MRDLNEFVEFLDFRLKFNMIGMLGNYIFIRENKDILWR